MPWHNLVSSHIFSTFDFLRPVYAGGGRCQTDTNCGSNSGAERTCPNFHSFHGIRVGNIPHVDRIHLHELMIRVSMRFGAKEV